MIIKNDFMKKIFFAVLLVVGATVIYSCSSPAYVEKAADTNLSNYKTYMWVTTRASENDESTKATSFVDIPVRNAVNAELRDWGWTEVTNNPDVFVSYDVLVEKNVERQSDPVYSQPFTRLYYNPYRRRWSTIYYPSQFLGYQEYSIPVREATVTISMMDADTDKKIWQGWTTETLGSSGIGDLNVRKSVRNIFKESGNTAP